MSETPGETLHAFVGAFVDALARAGVAHAALCPGSRSTPLALELRRHPGIRLWTHLDERSAAYFALGIAKAARQPVAVLSTSGTAAVNFAPAITEASYSGAPLLALTADRPPELHGAGAPQTVDQLHLYGSHVKAFISLPPPESGAAPLRSVRSVATRAVASATAPPAGPVHLNFPFREPLIPARASPEDQSTGDMGGVAPELPPVQHAAQRPVPEEVVALADALAPRPRGIIVCGPQRDPEFPGAVARLAARLDYPILADPLSLVRCGRHDRRHVVDCYDAVLRDPDMATSLAPQAVLRFGGTPASRPLLEFLAPGHDGGDRAPMQVLVAESGRWNDPMFSATTAFLADPRAFCEALTAALGRDQRPAGGGGDGWSATWRAAAAAARESIAEQIGEEPALSEPGVIREVAAMIPDGAALFAGNSMPVRDLDTFFPSVGRSIEFLGNRGASGIDGVVSTALGASAVHPGPLVLVIGDLSLAHDLNGLLAARRHGLRAAIVLVNNDGGGIFSFLPQAEHAEHFEELFGTPHGLDFRHAATLYGLRYRRCERAAELREALGGALREDGVALIEVRTDRAENAALHRRIWQAVAHRSRAALAAGVAG